MPSETIQWFPGHMAKARRTMQEHATQVDIVLQVLDARIPLSSRNPEIRKIFPQKPILTILTKASLADPAQSARWSAYLHTKGEDCVFVDSITGEGISQILPAMQGILREKLERFEQKGMTRPLRAMIVGIPNVGKSALINRLAGARKAKAENRPGVTRSKQWVSTSIGLDLLDMPGVLWPKFNDAAIGENLAITGAIRDQILDVEELAMILCGRLRDVAPLPFQTRYRLTDEELEELDTYDLLQAVGQKRGCLMAGGVVNARRTAELLLEEFRSAAIGRITLERPPLSAVAQKENGHA